MATTMSATRRLGEVAADLRPARPPYYMSIPDPGSEPAPGWYLVPAGTDHPVYLGHNVFAAFEALLSMKAHRGATAA
ncbi:hypothetical protein GKE82_05855 [Conexibacter sp. W3-3-2]|uniref:hypothetical protein n=1 Tax=Conexibacter sp. W3-3-2 TaxID=2675227 RepID=UPI0012B726D1|nr:hypothetical protein [Conexibacter sp. W3-3-2]MTD43840.1 hypothetical protein [Conexibacter sp. W3-3-2]